MTAPSSAGLMYVSLPDPFNGTKTLSRVTRADGKTIAPENVWISKKRNADHSLSYSINLFDANSPGIYTLALATPPNAPHPPVIQFIPDRTVKEGEQVSFIVDASDPDGTVPTISITGLLPGGAQFTPQAATNNVAHAAFSWTPATGQAGRYPITFTASDGTLTASATTVITVTTPTPPAGPDTPVISQPGVATTVKILEPDLAVAASANPLDTAVNYEFEIYSDAGFTNRIAQNPNVPKTATGATWKVPVTLADNTNYYWRVRAYDGAVYSAWAVGRFFLNTANDAPSAPAIAAPVSGMTVDTPAPTLTVANSVDPDGEAVVYGFEVYTDSTLSQKVAEVNSMAAGANGATSWTVAPVLNDTTPYYWRASATDPHGAKTYSAVANFLVDTTKPAPGVPGISAPAVGGVVSTAGVMLTVTNSTKPAGTVLNYYFELDKDKSFGSLNIVRSGAVPEGQNVTGFSVTGLAENTRYYWRAKSGDGLTESAWVYGEFFVDQANDAPTIPVLLNPGNNAFVSTRQPILEVGPAVDPENDAIAYHIEVYSDAALSNRVAERLTNNLTWLVEPMLVDATTYYWRARAEDLRGGASAWSAAGQFAVRTGQTSRPLLTVVSPSTVVQTSGPTVSINWEIDDPEHASTIALYYDSDNQGEDGTLIANSIAQDPASNVGSYPWNISSLAPGTYYIYVQATNRNGTTTRYAPGAFLIPVPQPRGGITLTPTTALTTTEAGGTAAFTAALMSSPKADVTVGFTVTQPGEASVAPPELTFTAANWSSPQTVTVTGLPDCLNDGDQTYQVIPGKAMSADPDYNGVQATALTLVNRGSTVGCPSNNLPVANAGPDQTVDAASTVVLTGSGTDSDGAINAYQWTQTAGPTVVITNADKATASFIAPSPGVDTALSFELTVTDNQGAVGKDSIGVTVRAKPNTAPVANAGLDRTVAMNSAVTLAGGGTDSDGTIAAYQWTQIAGPTVVLTGANTASAGFTAPVVTTPTVFGFTLTVTDNQGATGTASVAITVAPNQAPTANAGSAQTVNEGATVSLSGSGSDSDGTIASYAWTQTAGSAVTLSGAASATATFTAPQVSADTVLTFKLTVTDNSGATGEATVNVTVHDVAATQVLQNGTAVTGLSGATGTEFTYTLDVPVGASNLTV
ncbi:MAG: PKD domain-containing protein, partial [Planctomycetota bacterium]